MMYDVGNILGLLGGILGGIVTIMIALVRVEDNLHRHVTRAEVGTVIPFHKADQPHGEPARESGQAA